MKMISKNLEETAEIVRDFLKKLDKNGHGKNAIIAGLFGDLGSGKTTFTQAAAKTLGITENVTSPTFVIMKSYDLAAEPLRGLNSSLSGSTAKSQAASIWRKLIHIDAYRLKSGEELMKLNFDEIAKDPKNLILIEWPENVKDALPADIQKIYFKFVDENTREIEFDSN